ncbi:hypothetical protein [Curtanaerobium respiraculi]|uniref:hypothetical protein n=1 Tax=Curtanaerobium respiraculi TaxID=2949669 RepID=UPI0024B355F0|nr:hypothetical protein [Curtanaerobium respiraculi]
MCTTDIPRGALRSLGNGLFVASPEFCFLQMASKLSFYRLIRYGHEICGSYAMQRGTPRGFIEARPLTSVANTQTFLARYPDAHGRARAMHALPWVVENAASPMETAVGMILHLPMRYGGFGLPRHSFNREVLLSPTARNLAGRKTCRLDLSWEGVKYDLEYLGKIDHEGQTSIERDSRRVHALEYDGYQCDSITRVQVMDPFDMEVIARKIAREIGTKRHWERMGKYRGRRIMLYNDLFPWAAPFDTRFR